MRKIVFTIKDDVCLANAKDVNATRLIEVMKTYGSVEDYDAHVSGIKDEYQKTLDNVVAQNEAIKAQNLTEDEIAIVNSYRTQKAIVSQGFIEENNALRKTLTDVRAKHESTLALIASAIKENN